MKFNAFITWSHVTDAFFYTRLPFSSEFFPATSSRRPLCKKFLGRDVAARRGSWECAYVAGMGFGWSEFFFVPMFSKYSLNIRSPRQRVFDDLFRLSDKFEAHITVLPSLRLDFSLASERAQCYMTFHFFLICMKPFGRCCTRRASGNPENNNSSKN